MSIYRVDPSEKQVKLDNMNYFQWQDSHVIDNIDVPGKVNALLVAISVLNNYHEKDVKGKAKHNIVIANIAVKETYPSDAEFVSDGQYLKVENMELISNLCSNNESKHVQLSTSGLRSLYHVQFPCIVKFLEESGVIHDKEISEALNKCATNSYNLNTALSVVYNKVQQYGISPKQFAEYVEDLLPLQVLGPAKEGNNSKFNAQSLDGSVKVVDKTDFPYVNYYTLGGRMNYLDICGELSNFTREYVSDKLLYGPEKYIQQIHNTSLKDILSKDREM